MSQPQAPKVVSGTYSSSLSTLKQEIHALAEQYLATILALSPRPVAVHLMGELTFSFALVGLLQALGITCVASTARRQVIEKSPGRKEAIFEFVQFRAY